MKESDDWVIRPAERRDVHHFTGGVWPCAGNVWAAEYKDELVAVAGIVTLWGQEYAFSYLGDEIPVPKRIVWLGAKKLWANIKKAACGKMIKVTADRETSPVLLSHLGFVHDQGDEWIWVG
jgi:hypothetical protein